ncbi:MAG: mucoidy inhibitor MuiA family protein [Deltaproteobacteria bacterium]|nr:mucoidy inhibitor MuiA family protein [Deltaproteobacteria bacterium]
MKRMALLPAALLVIGGAAATAEAQSPPRVTGPAPALLRVAGKVDSVVVFSDRAVVHRVLSLRLERSSGVLRFHSLPVTLVRDSVRATGKSITITGVAVRPTPPTSDREWLTDPLRLAVDALDQKIRVERDRHATYAEQLRLLSNLGGLTTAQSDRELRLGAVKTEGWKAAVEFLEEKREAYHAKIRAVSLALEKLQRQRDEAQSKLSAAMLARRGSPIEVEVSYSGRTGASAEVTLEYTVTNVSWTPLYDLRGSAEGGAFQLVSNANIRQASGEAWENARVTLSTARPSVGTAPGTLQPWRVAQRSLASPTGGGQRRGYGGENDGGVAGPDAGGALASTTMTVALPARESIASDNSDHRVTLRTSKLQGSLVHVAIPSLTPQVFLRAQLNNGTGIPLLGGNVSVFLDGNFVGIAAFSHLAAAGEDFHIYLGPDQRLQVKRTLLRGDVEGSGIFTKKVTVTNRWQIEIANYSGRTRQVVVQDQFPVSADPSIETRLVGTSRHPDRRDQNGMLTWKCDVPQGKREHLDFTYSLTVTQAMWDRFEQQQLAEERRQANAGYHFDSAAEAPAAAAPSPAPAMPAKARRMYNLEMMIQKR